MTLEEWLGTPSVQEKGQEVDRVRRKIGKTAQMLAASEQPYPLGSGVAILITLSLHLGISPAL